MPIQSPSAKPVSGEAVRPLRHAVLRPTQPYENTRYPLDSEADTFHCGVEMGGTLTAVGSIFHEDESGGLCNGTWRIRGMASAPEVRGLGHGEAVLELLVEHARRNGGKMIWANARTTATGFYQKFGFQTEGDEYDMPGLGPHYLLKLQL